MDWRESSRTCDKFFCTLNKEQEWVGLEQCPHTLCPKCFIDCLIAQGHKDEKRLAMSSKQHCVESHINHAWDRDENIWVQSRMPQDPHSKLPALQSDPFRYFHSLGAAAR